MRAYIYDTASNPVPARPVSASILDGVEALRHDGGQGNRRCRQQVMGATDDVAEYHIERLCATPDLLEIGGGTLESHQKNITRDLAKMHDAILR